MKVFISADIEGITGITDWSEADLAHADNAQFRERFLGEFESAVVRREIDHAAGLHERDQVTQHLWVRLGNFPIRLS